MANNSQISPGQRLPGWLERWISDSTNILIAARSRESEARQLHTFSELIRSSLRTEVRTEFRCAVVARRAGRLL
jgi:hypothetical protein